MYKRYFEFFFFNFDPPLPGAFRGQNFNFQNICHRVCNETRMKIQSDKKFWNPTVISTRLSRISTCKISACYGKAYLKILSCKVQFSWGFSFRGFSVTFTRVLLLAVTRKWNVAGVYLHLLYNMRSVLLIIASQLWIFKQILLLPNFAYV